MQPAADGADGAPEGGESRWTRTLRWVGSHKFKTILLVILAVVLAEMATIPWFGVRDLATHNPSETALMRQRISEAEKEGKPLKIKQHWISLSRLPRHLIDAVVVAEDGTFFTHGGIDWFEVQESIEKNIEEKRAARGASTITQQLAKNLYLSTSKDPVRKFKEVVITLLLEKTLDKNRILELYLNLIEWGRGVFGVEAAAQTYFGKSASLLTLEESTRLAAVIPSPLRHRPDADSRYVVRRKQIVLDRMSARNMTDHSLPKENTSSGNLNRQPQHPVDTTGTVIPRDSSETDEGESNGL